jgi:hypothetical protein
MAWEPFLTFLAFLSRLVGAVHREYSPAFASCFVLNEIRHSALENSVASSTNARRLVCGNDLLTGGIINNGIQYNVVTTQ